MRFPNFTRTIEDLNSNDFTVHKAEYWGDVFGSWLVEFSSKTVRRHRLVWDGKERWLTLQYERPESERSVAATPEQLRKMSYEDGVMAYHEREADAWAERWMGTEEADWSLERALQEVR